MSVNKVNCKISNESLMTRQSSRMMLIMIMKTTCIPEHLNDDVGEGVLVVLYLVYLLACLHLLVTKNRQKSASK
jgi:hypothetical protein